MFFIRYVLSNCCYYVILQLIIFETEIDKSAMIQFSERATIISLFTEQIYMDKLSEITKDSLVLKLFSEQSYVITN